MNSDTSLSSNPVEQRTAQDYHSHGIDHHVEEIKLTQVERATTRLEENGGITDRQRQILTQLADNIVAELFNHR